MRTWNPPCGRRRGWCEPAIPVGVPRQGGEFADDREGETSQAFQSVEFAGLLVFQFVAVR
jgi:hypothetical protein